MTPWMASSASAGELKSGESETTLPIIAGCVTLLARHLNETPKVPLLSTEGDGITYLCLVSSQSEQYLGHEDTACLYVDIT